MWSPSLGSWTFDAGQRERTRQEFWESRIDNGSSTFWYLRKGHFVVTQMNSFFVDFFVNVQKLFETVSDKRSKMAMDMRHIFNCESLHNVPILALIFEKACGPRCNTFFFTGEWGYGSWLPLGGSLFLSLWGHVKVFSEKVWKVKNIEETGRKGSKTERIGSKMRLSIAVNGKRTASDTYKGCY